MVTSKAASRYATALFDLARERGRLDQVRKDMQGIRDLVESSEEFRNFLAHPLISTEARTKGLDKLLRKRIEVLTFQFLLLLDEKRRLNVLGQICTIFEDLYHDHKGILRVKITSAVDLDPQQIDAISKALKAKFKKEIEPETTADPSLIGGFKVQVGDQIYDNCISTRLETFRQQLTKA